MHLTAERFCFQTWALLWRIDGMSHVVEKTLADILPLCFKEMAWNCCATEKHTKEGREISLKCRDGSGQWKLNGTVDLENSLKSIVRNKNSKKKINILKKKVMVIITSVLMSVSGLDVTFLVVWPVWGTLSVAVRYKSGSPGAADCGESRMTIRTKCVLCFSLYTLSWHVADEPPTNYMYTQRTYCRHNCTMQHSKYNLPLFDAMVINRVVNGHSQLFPIL